MRQFMLKLGSVLLLASLFFNTALAADSVADKRIAAGRTSSLFIDTSGALWAWGTTDSRRIKVGVPARIMAGAQAVSASTGSIYSLVIKQDGSLWGWGDSYRGQLGVETKSLSDWIKEPIQILPAVRSVVAGEDTVFAIKPDGSMWAWGQAGERRGDKLKENLTTPRKVMDKVKQVSTSSTHTLALKEDGSLWAWGINRCGALGDGTLKSSYRPRKVNLKALRGRKIVRISTHVGDSYAVTEDGLLWRWGERHFFRPGCIEDVKILKPIRVEEIRDVQDIANSWTEVLLLKKDGTVWMIDLNGSRPWQEPRHLLSDAQEIAAGESHFLVLKKDSTVWSWGDNDYGQLGNGTVWAPGDHQFGRFNDGTRKSDAKPRQVIFPK